MDRKLKTKKCRRKACRKVFQPVVRWQEYCHNNCRSADQYAGKVKLLRRAQRIIDAQGAS